MGRFLGGGSCFMRATPRSLTVLRRPGQATGRSHGRLRTPPPLVFWGAPRTFGERSTFGGWAEEEARDLNSTELGMRDSTVPLSPVPPKHRPRARERARERGGLARDRA